MDLNRFTEKLQEGVRSAQSLAAQRGQQQVDAEASPARLVRARRGGLAQSVLAKTGVVNWRICIVARRSSWINCRVVSGSGGKYRHQIYVTARLQSLLYPAPKPKPSASPKTTTFRSSMCCWPRPTKKVFKDAGLTREMADAHRCRKFAASSA